MFFLAKPGASLLVVLHVSGLSVQKSDLDSSGVDSRQECHFRPPARLQRPVRPTIAERDAKSHVRRCLQTWQIGSADALDQATPILSGWWGSIILQRWLVFLRCTTSGLWQTIPFWKLSFENECGSWKVQDHASGVSQYQQQSMAFTHHHPLGLGQWDIPSKVSHYL